MRCLDGRRVAYLRRRRGEGVAQLGELGRVAPRRRDVQFSQLLDERPARRGSLAQLGASLRERFAARARIHLEAVGAPLGAFRSFPQFRNLGRISSCISRSSDRVHHAAEEAAEAFALAARPGRVAALLPYIDCLDLHDAAVVVEAHEDAFSFKAADLAALAVEGGVTT